MFKKGFDEFGKRVVGKRVVGKNSQKQFNNPKPHFPQKIDNFAEPEHLGPYMFTVGVSLVGLTIFAHQQGQIHRLNNEKNNIKRSSEAFEWIVKSEIRELQNTASWLRNRINNEDAALYDNYCIFDNTTFQDIDSHLDKTAQIDPVYNDNIDNNP